jgi:hypothetical protein
MKIAFLLLAASLALPVTVAGQALTSATPVENARPIPYATIEADRVGIRLNKPLDEASLRIRNDSARSGVHVVDHIRHAVIGGFFGTLAGAAIGAGSGAWIDAHYHGDVIIPATVVLGIYGTIGGLAVGLITGAIWPVR